jgi:hypothetical protein
VGREVKQPLDEDPERTEHSVLTPPLGTILTPTKLPKDFIGVVLMDVVMAELVLILDGYAMKLFYTCSGKSNNQNQNRNKSDKIDHNIKIIDQNTRKKVDNKDIEKNFDTLDNTCLTSTALRIVQIIIKSNSRKVLVPMVFRVLIAHCGLRVKVCKYVHTYAYINIAYK